MENLQKLNDSDFRLINEALDSMADDHNTNRLKDKKEHLESRIKSIPEIVNHPQYKGFQEHVNKMMLEAVSEFETKIESIRILQVKLIELKRELSEQAQVNAANDLLK